MVTVANMTNTMALKITMALIAIGAKIMTTSEITIPIIKIQLRHIIRLTQMTYIMEATTRSTTTTKFLILIHPHKLKLWCESIVRPIRTIKTKGMKT